MLNDALRGHALWAKVLRFGIVGGASTGLYGVFTWLLIEQLGRPPLLATALGYLLVIPFNFGLQRVFTFRSAGSPKREVPRFLLVHGLNLAASVLGMHAALHVMHADYRLGIVLTMVMVPIATFVAMNLWVFRRQSRDSRGDASSAPDQAGRPASDRRKDEA